MLVFLPRIETRGDLIRGKFSKLGDDWKLSLDGSNSMEEVHKTLEEMGSYKALGPDGLQVVFFKRTWMQCTRLFRGCWRNKRSQV